MYDDYFGLKDSPFSIAPNPRYLYMSERHREALAHLLYGVRSDGGFILLTGEVGTGKTTVCRCLIEQIPENVDIAFILNPKLTARELLAAICDDLGIEYPADVSIKGLVDRLNAFLLSSLQADRRTVLIIDEAQNLSADVLEQLRLLTNLETSQRKLLQIILLGQPELLALLSQPELRQLSQRITARFHLEALDRREVAEYVEHRLSIAGCQRRLFRRDAVNRVFKLSQGVPRLINLICDRSLLGAYVEDRTVIDAKIVNKAAREILGSPSPARSSPWLVSGLAASLVMSVGVASIYYVPDLRDRLTGLMPAPEQVASSPPAADVMPAESPPGTAGTAITASATAQPAEPRVETTPLNQVSGHPQRELAFVDLLALWDTPYNPDRDPCGFSSTVSLKCLERTGSLRELAYLNRPALLSLSVTGEDHWFTLTGLDEETAELRAGPASFVIDRQALLANWDGEYTLLWRAPPTYQLPLHRGDSGSTVDWLVSRLDAIDQNDPVIRTGMDFDEALESRVKRFQISVGLRPDGIVGARTWIHINTRYGANAPLLNTGNRG